MAEVLRHKEQALAQESFPSAADFETVSRFINFPSNVEGLVIVDICAGASTATAQLRRRGAKAYAIDYRYQNLKFLKRDIDRFLTNPPHINAQKQTLEEAAHKMPLGADPRLWALAVEMAKKQLSRPQIDDAEYARRSRQARDRFFRSIARDQAYIAALAGNLPLHTGSVDFAFSLQGISRFLMKDKNVLIETVAQALRVLKSANELKPDGELQLHPWIGGSIPWLDEELKGAIALQDYLKNHKIPYFVEQVPAAMSPRIRIVKT